ncbi:hypothetical protein [Streptomyces sp. NPDC005438]|uniref:hypothetical protein n=1 Tax=Streptomyces sp. NPDC005438 TaxID=3156880 RepID=UPI0033BD01BE
MAHIDVGPPDIAPDGTAHLPGVHQGNSPDSGRHQPGLKEDGTSTARRSTGINAGPKNPIQPDMPNLSPA